METSSILDQKSKVFKDITSNFLDNEHEAQIEGTGNSNPEAQIEESGSSNPEEMDPNHPNYTISLSKFDDAFFNHPQFKAALQRRGMTMSQNPSPCLDSQENSPHVSQGSNSQHEEDAEENVPDTPQYPSSFPAFPIMENQTPARTTRSWSVAEDTTLIALYMQFIEDAMVGTNQKASDLWRKVSRAWNQAQLEKPHVIPPRELKSLECHWRRMATDLLQWSVAYNEAGKLDASNQNEVDRLQRAMRLFSMTSKPKSHNFTYQHAWEVVRKDPKFRNKLRWALSKDERVACAVDDDGSSGSGKRSRTKGAVESEVAAASYSSGGIPRPEGVKKAKAKRNKGKATPGEDRFIGEQMKLNNEQRKFEYNLKVKKYEFQLQKEMRKQRQVEMEERLKRDRMDMEEKKMKVQLLQVLMSKGSPLTPTEEEYKDQLWQEVCGQSSN